MISEIQYDPGNQRVALRNHQYLYTQEHCINVSRPGRDWGQEEKGMTEDEMAGWHHRLNGREFE